MNLPTNGTIEINGIPMVMENVQMTVSNNYRELVTTKIMNSTEANTQGEWQPREFSFTTYLRTANNQINELNSLIDEIQHKPCEIVYPDLGEIFKGFVKIVKNRVDSHGFELSVSVKELAGDTIGDYYIDNNIITTNRLETSEK